MLPEKKIFYKRNEFKEFIELDKKYKFIEHYVSFHREREKRKIRNSMILDHKYIKNNIRGYLNLVNNFFSLNFKRTYANCDMKLDIKNFKASSSRSVRISKNKIKFSEKSIHLFLKIAKKGIWQF